jgi:hypothetical protein
MYRVYNGKYASPSPAPVGGREKYSPMSFGEKYEKGTRKRRKSLQKSYNKEIFGKNLS